MPVSGGHAGLDDASMNQFGSVVGPTLNFGARMQSLQKPTWTGGYAVPTESRVTSDKAFDFPTGNTARLLIVGLVMGLGALIIYRTR